MATLNLWKNFEKRKNSTKQPPSTSGSYDTLSVVLKEGTSLEQPVFIIKSNDFSYNYAQFNGTYYYVDDIVSEKNQLLELHCSRDLLATYKAKIQTASAFVLYYTHSNTEISDKRLATKTTKTVDTATGSFDTLGNGSGTNYAVILNTIGLEACDSYAVSQANARTILSDLDNWFEDDDFSQGGSGMQTNLDDPIFSWTSVEDAIKSFLQETLFFWKQWFASGKVSDNLRSAYVLPLPVSAISGNTHHVQLGQYKSQVEGTRVYDRIFSDGTSVNIPWQATDWRRNAPYHEVYLYIPYVGLISLSPSDLIGDTSLNVSVSIDVTCGDAIFTVYTGSNRFIGQYTANMAAPFAVGTSNVPITQQINTLVGATVAGAAAVVSGGGTAVLAALTGGTLSLANDISGVPSCIGSNMGGAVLGLTDQVVCYTVFHDTTVSPSSVSAVKGTPYNGVMSLSGVSGYVQTSGASVEVGAFGNDKDIINSYLNGGIYIE